LEQVEEEVNDPEIQEDAQQVECLDMEALPSGSNQVVVEADVLQGEDEDKESVG